MRYIVLWNVDTTYREDEENNYELYYKCAKLKSLVAEW